MTGIDLQLRINKLTLNSLRAALFAIDDVSVIEAAVTAGEQYQELREKITRKREQK